MSKKSKKSKEGYKTSKSNGSTVKNFIWIIVGIIMIATLIQVFILINKVQYYFP